MGIYSDASVATSCEYATNARDRAATERDRLDSKPYRISLYERDALRFTHLAHAVWHAAREDERTDPLRARLRTIVARCQSHANLADTCAEIDAEMGDTHGQARQEAEAKRDRQLAALIVEAMA